jgi:hypothetical protein
MVNYRGVNFTHYTGLRADVCTCVPSFALLLFAIFLSSSHNLIAYAENNSGWYAESAEPIEGNED